MKLAWLIIWLVLPVCAQTNGPRLAAGAAGPALTGNVVKANLDSSRSQRAEQVRNACIVGRRSICGKILQVLPDGLVVESGYIDLLRPALSKSWLVPGVAVVHRRDDLIESHEAGSPCVGVVFLRDLPRIRGSKPRPKKYDYIVLSGYPAGKYTYSSVGDIHKTVRQFSANLLKAVDLKLEAERKSGAAEVN